MMDRQRQIQARKRRLRRHIATLTTSVQNDVAACFDPPTPLHPDVALSMEEQFQKIESLLRAVEGQMDEAASLAEVTRCAERAAFLEERLDELESEMYRRPRQRRRPFRFARFFQFTQQGTYAAPPSAGISIPDAYRALGLEQDADLLGVTAAFRHFVKEYHPDTRGGDRSAESNLRKVMESYQLLKEHLEKE